MNWLKNIFKNWFSKAEKTEKQPVLEDLPMVIAPKSEFKQPVTCIVIGAGARGSTYAWYAEHFSEDMKVVGVVERNEIRRNKFAKRYKLNENQVFEDWKTALSQQKWADCVFITTPDNEHFAPTMLAMEKGYDILLEKPIAQTESECLQIVEQQQKHGNIVAVCHVLRYSPYFQQLKKVINEGGVGELVSIQHFEPIEHQHMAHSYVRGNWRNSETTTPIIIAKSSHDLDILNWLIAKKPLKVAAFGGLHLFKKENAPVGSALHCVDCQIEKTCPYSALKIYDAENGRFNYVLDIPYSEIDKQNYIHKTLKTSPFGRCVYHCDNNQPDHYVLSAEYENGITANFSMEAFTSYEGRRTRIMGTMGDIVGDMNSFTHTNFIDGEKTVWAMENILHAESYKQHGGGDFALVRDFLKAVYYKDEKYIITSLSDSFDSHLLGFKAEESRLEGKVVFLSS